MAVAIGILYTVRDAKNETSTMQINLPSATAITDVTIFASQMATLLNAAIKGAITRIGVALTVDLPAGLRASPLADADVEEGALFQFTTDGGFRTSFRVPTFDEDLISAGSRDVDTTDGAVASLIAAMTAGLNLTAGGGSGVVEPSDARDDDVAALVFAREQFTKSRG